MNDRVIDQAVYAELRDTTGAEFVAELVDTFLDEAPGILAELQRAREDGHDERFRRAAHSLKTNGNTFGALKLAALARELELEGIGAEPSAGAARLAELETIYVRSARELLAMRDE
jgi:HPt (histidine-containing phosphotransfer) domain-containing protein